MFRMKRTYPSPDSAEENIGPRERALAVFKFLCRLEPEAAIKHPLFATIENAFLQERRRALLDLQKAARKIRLDEDIMDDLEKEQWFLPMAAPLSKPIVGDWKE